jgi:phenylalanyl-tRNA synthetase alpha subunit
VRTQFRKIFTQMGFEEMPTNNYVESSFWNFDALFQPQQVSKVVSKHLVHTNGSCREELLMRNWQQTFS